MPKKYKQGFSNQNSNYIHPSLSSGKSASAQAPLPPATVNERLSQLRKEQVSPDLSERQRALAESSRLRSIPPNLGGILGLPESAPPLPPAGFRPPRTRLRTPGPAPPQSWLSPSQGAQEPLDDSRWRSGLRTKRTFSSKPAQARPRPAGLCRFAEVVGEPSLSKRSLAHFALRTVAQQWDALDEDGLQYLSELPVHLRTVLLGYIAKYGPEEGLAGSQLSLILNGMEDLSCVDLSGLCGWTFSLRELHTALRKLKRQKPKSDDTMTESVVESWDQESVNILRLSDLPMSPAPTMTTSSITKLSLANPPSTIFWPDLLNLTSSLPTLTHLSLAHWPFPTKTPNMTNTTTTTRHGTISASGSTVYSTLDSDFAEAATLLRTLSKQTYCLHWLDLSGNSKWIPALAQQKHQTTGRGLRTDAWEADVQYTGPDWAGAWSGITYLNLGQGLSPAELGILPLGGAERGAFGGGRAVQMEEERKLRAEVAEWLAVTEEEVRGSRVVCNACHRRLGDSVGAGIAGRGCVACLSWRESVVAETNLWIEREVDARRVGRCCARFRGPSVAGPMVVDYGWCAR